MGQPAGLPQDDGAALPGRDQQPDPGSLGRYRGQDQGHLRRSRGDTRTRAGHRHRSGISGCDHPRRGRVHPPDPAGAHRLRLRDRGERAFLPGGEPVRLRGGGRELFRPAAESFRG